MIKDSTDAMLPIPSGSLIVFTEDEYSSYSIMGTFRALQELRPSEIRESYLNSHPDQRDEYRFHPLAFLAWLMMQGYVEEVHSWEWHVDATEVHEMGT